MKKKLSLLIVLLFSLFTSAWAGLHNIAGDKVIYSWPSDGTAANKVTLAEGVTVEINGNTDKTVSNGSAITVGETQYTSMKVSNGAQNTLTLSKNAVAVTFYSYINKDSSTKDSYWKEVNGVNYDATTSGGAMASFKKGANPDVRRYEFETPTKTITFNNAGEQLCYIVEVEYEDGDTPTPDEPSYYVVGSMTNWETSEDYLLVKNAGAEGEYMFTGDFKANDEIKVKSSEGNWYPDTQGGNYVFQNDGNFTIYFRPAGNQDWPNIYFYVAENVPVVKDPSTSLNIEQLVLDEGTSADIATILTRHNIEFKDINALDSLNDDKTDRNEPFLGLKVKTQGAYINVVLEKGKTLKVKFGCVNDPVTVSINGTPINEQIAANKAGGDVFTLDAADADREVTFTTTTAKTVVFKQIMIGEDIAEVTLPAPLKTFTATFTTDYEWEKVYAYAWTGDGEQAVKFLGDWPGTELQKAETGAYTCTIEAAEAPANIIFNNGSSGEGNQTDDLAFEDGKAYSFNKPVPTKYTVSIAEDIQNGTVNVVPTEYEAGQEVTVVATPAENYELEAITAVGKTTNEAIRVTDGKFTMIADDVIVSATFKEIPQLVGYFVVGNMNEWSYDEAYQMQESPTAQGIYEFTAKFAAKDELKVKSMMSDKSFTWYPDNMDNFVIPQDGEYTITFNPAGGVEDWYGGFFNVVMKEEPIVVNDYTVQFVNGADWQQVYAYTWTGKDPDKVEQLGPWAGKEMGVIDTEAEIDGKKYPVYELKFSAAVEPDSIVFSNGRGGEAGVTQTADLEFVNEYQYALVLDDEPVNPDQQEEEIEFTAAGTGTNPMVYTKDHFTYTFDKGTGSTNPAYVTSAEETRLYAKGSLTIKARGSEKIIGITYDATINPNSKGVSPTIDGVAGKTNAGTWDAENWSWTGEDTEVTMTTSGSAGNVGFKGITVTYTDEGGGGDQPVEIKTMAIVGDFLGLEATGESNNPNWDPANGWEMTQSTDNPAIWTYVKEGFVAEAKKYEYKAAANGNWEDYVLPEKGNQDFVFGTDMYPAGTYTLTFTANTSTHELTLDVAKDGISTVKELNAQANGTEFKFLGDAIVVATPAKGQSRYVYIKDATGNSLIFDKSGELTADIAVGNVITAPWEGTVSIYKSLFEAVPSAALGATSTVQVVIPEGYPEDVVADSVNKVMEIKGLSIDNVDGQNIKFTIGNAAVVGYNQFGIELPADYEGKTFDVVGAVGRYNDNIQFQPITITEVVEPVETYTATFTTNLGWKPVYAYAYNYTPADEAEGVQEHFYEPVEWPGTPMTLNDETGVYEVAIESAEEPNLIIFNDGTKEGSQVGINQTPNWEFENEKAYDYSTQPFAASFTTDKAWEKVYAYVWKANIQAPVEWPGVEITDTKDGDTYYYAFQSTYAPDFIIFNNGTEAEVKEQTSDLVFEDGANYSLTTEKTTAWAGDPEVAISTTTGITIPAKAFEKADVQAEKIIHIVAKEISTAAPAKGFNSDVAELKPTDIAILKNEEPFDKVLIEETAIQVVDDGYQFVADNAVAQEITDHGFVIKPLGDKQIGVEYVEVEQAKAPAAVVNIDFAPAPTDDIGAVIEARAAEITAAGNKVGNITITLGAIGTPYTTTKAIVAPAGVLIQGAGAATSIIDASGLEGPFILMSTTPSVEGKDVDGVTAYEIDGVTIQNVAITGLKAQLFYANKTQYLLKKLSVENSIIGLTNAKTIFDFNSGGNVVELSVNKSTLYGPNAGWSNGGFHSTQSSKSVLQLGGTTEKTIITNSTLYNISYTKTTSTIVKNSQDWMSYEVKNNVIVNCGKSGQFLKGLNSGQAGKDTNWDVDNNIFNFDGANIVETCGASADNVKNSIAGVVTFTDAANADFNGTFALGEGASEPATKPGDPRWTITYATPVEITTMSIVGEFTGGWPVQDPETSAWDWSMAKAMTQDAENANIWTLEMPFVAEAKKYEYKAAANSNWNDYVLPLSENANFIFGTDEYPAGEYILTFTADTKNHTVGVVAKWNGPEDIKVVPEEGSDISTAVQTASEGKKVKDIYVYLAPGKKFTISKSIVAPAAFVIMGAADGTNPSDIDENATMAEIDASALDGPMVKMSETPAVAADANGFYPLADVGFLNVKVTGLTQQLFYANKQKYLINCFHVDFCNINVAGGSKTIIDTNGGGVIATLDMSKNTIWANPENTGALYSSQSGQKATEAGLAVQTFNIEKNTMYNIAKGKNFCSHRQSNQTWLIYNVKNNTFVNCGKSGQVIKGLNGGSGGANPTWNVDGNAFNFEGADTSANEETGDADEPVKNSLAGVFTFTDAAAGDFNGVFKSEAAEAPAKYPGDPRWTYTYESTAPAKFYLIGSMNNWDRTALTEMTFNETTQAYEYDYAPTEKVWFAFADKQMTAEEATADPEWADFNANHRYAIGAGDVNAPLNEAIALQKGDGTLVLEAGSYKISVAKDLSTVTITGEAPEHTYTVAGSFYYADGSVAIFGTEWDVANTANDMEKQLDGTYKKVYTIDFPFAGNIQFKVAENHAWDVSYGWDVTAENPDGNAFYAVASPANGATVTITFDPNGATAADKVKIEVTGIPTVGINGIVTDDADDNAPIYNLAGQKVDKNYKGVVIKNGKKIYQK